MEPSRKSEYSRRRAMLSSGNCAVIGNQLGGGGGGGGGGGAASVVRNSVFSSEIDQVMLNCFSSVDRGEMAI